MAGAIIQGLLAKKAVPESRLFVSDPDKRRIRFFRSLGVRSLDNKGAASSSGILFLCVKPVHMKEVCEEIAPALPRGQTVVSIAAGITLGFLKRHLGSRRALVRVMPNTPCLIGKGMSVFCANALVSRKMKKTVAGLLSATGRVLYLRERHFDAVTGLSGSGPAYIFMVIGALAEAGRELGLPVQTALELASQTVLGSGELVLSTGRDPGELIQMVSSPGGTTIEGLKALEERDIRSAFIRAVRQAALKSKNLIKE